MSNVIQFPRCVSNLPRLRMDWGNRMNGDRRLKSASFRFAYIIGTYFSDDAAPKWIEKADLAEKCSRAFSTVERHIRLIEDCGYLRVIGRSAGYLEIEVFFDGPPTESRKAGAV